MKKQLTFLLGCFLVGCGPVTPIVSTPIPIITPIIPTSTPTLIPEPLLKFLPPNFLGSIDVNQGVNLGVGIYAVNKDVVFLLGGLGDQSTLLRSNDGGLHWVEVMNPVKGSSAVDFQMLETGAGWALVMWVVEGPGKVLLFHTADFGQTWKHLSEVTKPEWYSEPANMTFFDSKHGQMIMSVVGGLNDRLAFMTRTDGGVNWDETDSYSPTFDNLRMQGAAVSTLFFANKKDFSELTSLEDYLIRWKLEVSDNRIIISRQLHNEDYSLDDWK